MLYCEKCRLPVEEQAAGEERCPECGRKKLRQIREDDPCFLIERGLIWSEVVEDFLKQNGIPYLTKGRMGAGLAINVGPMFEKNRYFVPWSCLEKARELMNAVFEETEEKPEDGQPSGELPVESPEEIPEEEEEGEEEE